MGKVNIKQLNYAPDTGYVIGSGAGGVPIWKVEGSAVTWDSITGNQADINLSGFTNDSNFITLASLSAGTGISYDNLTGVITNTAPDAGFWTGNSSSIATTASTVTMNGLPIRTNVTGRGVYIGPNISTSFTEVNSTIGSVIIGEQAGFNLTGTLTAANVFIGSRAGKNISTGARNIAIGTLTLSADATSLSTIDRTICIGQQAGQYFQSGAENIGIGNTAMRSLRNNVNYNIAIGNDAMGVAGSPTFDVDNSTNNIAIGPFAMNAINSNQVNNVSIGSYSLSISNAFNNKLFINSSTTQPVDLIGLIVGDFVDRNVGINIDPSSIHSSAIFHISSTTKGVLHPLLTTAQKNAIATPATGLQLVDTDLDRPVYKTSSGWESLAFTTDIPSDPTITLSGDVSGSGTTSITTTIGNNLVTDAKIRQSAGLSVIGRSANSTGNVADITAGTDGHVLRRSGTSIGFGLVPLSSVSATSNHVPFGSANVLSSTSQFTFLSSPANRVRLNLSTSTSIFEGGIGSDFFGLSNQTIFAGYSTSAEANTAFLNYGVKIGGTFASPTDYTTGANAQLNGMYGMVYLSGAPREAASILIRGDGTSGATSYSGRIVFSTSAGVGNSTERMRIDKDGNVGINTATTSSKLDVVGDIEIDLASAFYIGDPTTDGTWRIIRSGSDLLSQRRESGSYVTKQTITP